MSKDPSKSIGRQGENSVVVMRHKFVLCLELYGIRDLILPICSFCLNIVQLLPSLKYVPTVPIVGLGKDGRT